MAINRAAVTLVEVKEVLYQCKQLWRQDYILCIDNKIKKVPYFFIGQFRFRVEKAYSLQIL